MNRFIVLGAVVLLVIIGWSGAWVWGASQINGYVAGLASADGVSSPKLTCGSFGVGGFPFGYDLTCTKATVLSGDTTVTLTGLKASVEVDNPFHVQMFAQSPVTLADAFTGSSKRLDFADARASALLTNWRIGRISLEIKQPVLNDTVVEDALIGKADRLEAHLVDDPTKHDATKKLAAVREYVEIDKLDAPGFAISGGQSTFDGEITNLPDDVRTYGDPDLLKRWQAAGGAFTLNGFKGDDSGSHFEATGTLALDPAGKVQGNMKINSKGVVERVEDQVPATLRPLVLGGKADDGSYTQTLTIGGGVVFSGLVPVTTIPPLF